jgi:hypothetical protein
LVNYVKVSLLLVNKTVIVFEPINQEILLTKVLETNQDILLMAFTDSRLYGCCLSREDSQQNERFQPKIDGSNI